MRATLCFCLMIIFTVFSSLSAQETITVQPDDKVVTNNIITRIKGGPMEPDLVKTVDLAENTLFSIKLNATNFDRYIRITSYSTNLDFVRFTRDKTNAFITFRTLTAGIGKLDFQVDNEENIIRKYLYTINVTNAQGTSVMETNAILDADDKGTNNNTSSTNQTIGTNDSVSTNNQTISTNNAISTNQTVSKPNATNDTKTTVSTNEAKKNNTQTSAIKPSETVKKPVETNPKIIAMFNSAEDLKNIKDYNNAINAYSNLTKEYPNSKYSVYSYFRMGDIYNNQKEYIKAFDMYEKALGSSSANNNEKAAAVYSMGVIKKLENKNEEALVYFNDVINKYSKTPMYGNAAYEVAEILKQAGRISDAAPLLEKSLASNSKFTKRGDSMLLLAEIYEKGNNNVRNFDKAYNTYDQYLSEYPTSPKAKYAYDRKNFLYRNAVNLR